MSVGRTQRHNKSGTVEYLQLMHNEWDPVKGQGDTKVLFTFGRVDELDRETVRRLVASLSRLLEPGEQLTAAAEFRGWSSCPAGGFGEAYVLDHRRRQLGIDTIVTRLGRLKRGRGAQVVPSRSAGRTDH